MLYANQTIAYNCYLLLPVLCPRGWRSWSVLYRCGSRCRWLNGCKPGQCSVGDGSKGTAGPLQFGTNNIAGVARMRLSTTNCVRDSQLRIFPRGLLLKPFPKKGNCKATVIIARWPPLALQNWRPLTDLVLTSIWVSNHPPHNLPCERWWGCRFSHRLVDPKAGSTGLQVTSRPWLLQKPNQIQGKKRSHGVGIIFCVTDKRNEWRRSKPWTTLQL